MAHTFRHVSRLAHTPVKEKLLTGEPNRGIGSVKKIVKAAAEVKVKTDAAKLNAETEVEASEFATENS